MGPAVSLGEGNLSRHPKSAAQPKSKIAPSESWYIRNSRKGGGSRPSRPQRKMVGEREAGVRIKVRTELF